MLRRARAQAGRTGREAPAEHIIASLVAITGAYTLPLALPFAHRYGPRALRRAVLALVGLSAATAAVFAMREPFDALHQRRLFVLSLENVSASVVGPAAGLGVDLLMCCRRQVTTQERVLHVGAADGAPGFEALVRDIAEEFGAPGAVAVQEEMHDWNGDWDVLYPFSAVRTLLLCFS